MNEHIGGQNLHTLRRMWAVIQYRVHLSLNSVSQSHDLDTYGSQLQMPFQCKYVA